MRERYLLAIITENPGLTRNRAQVITLEPVSSISLTSFLSMGFPLKKVFFLVLAPTKSMLTSSHPEDPSQRAASLPVIPAEVQGLTLQRVLGPFLDQFGQTYGIYLHTHMETHIPPRSQRYNSCYLNFTGQHSGQGKSKYKCQRNTLRLDSRLLESRID